MFTPVNLEKRYDKVITMVTEEDNLEHFLRTIKKESVKHKVLLIASWYTPKKSFAALHKDGIIILLNNIVCVFNPETKRCQTTFKNVGNLSI